MLLAGITVVQSGCKELSNWWDRPGPMFAARIKGKRVEAMRAYRSEELRFTDAFGRVRGHYTHNGRGLKELPDSSDVGLLCSYVMANPEHTQSCLKQAIAKGEDPAVVFMAAGVSGETAMLGYCSAPARPKSPCWHLTRFAASPVSTRCPPKD